jgi:hypothetical protein
MTTKEDFAGKLVQLANELRSRARTDDGQWTL